MTDLQGTSGRHDTLSCHVPLGRLAGRASVGILHHRTALRASSVGLAALRKRDCQGYQGLTKHHRMRKRRVQTACMLGHLPFLLRLQLVLFLIPYCRWVSAVAAVLRSPEGDRIGQLRRDTIRSEEEKRAKAKGKTTQTDELTNKAIRQSSNLTLP